jgi:hypothetical protein
MSTRAITCTLVTALSATVLSVALSLRGPGGPETGSSSPAPTAPVAAALSSGPTPVPASRSVPSAMPASTDTASPGRADDPPGIYGADPELTATIEGAVARFRSVGLELPELRIYAHSAGEGCRGHSGRFTHGPAGSRVDLCNRSEYTILHELAHVWEHHNMSDATRQEFLDRAGLEAWSDPELDWAERGIEAAAQTIAWGLLDVPIARPETFDEEIHLFELLTGITSPRLPGEVGSGSMPPSTSSGV